MIKVWTDERVEFLKENADGHSTEEITNLFNGKFGVNFKQTQIRGAMSRHKIKSNVKGTFQKGMTPWNKGMKGWSAKGTEHTRFKKGLTPQNKLPIGAELFWKDGYLYRKISDTGHRNTDWRPVHHLVWKERHGEIPEGHIVIFADKNKYNFDIDNLVCIKRSEALRMNQQKLHDIHPEITKVGINIVRLQNELRKKEN